MRKKRVVGTAIIIAMIVLATVGVLVLSDDAAPIGQECKQVQTSNSAGEPIPEVMLAEVIAVHDAACRRDYPALVAHAETRFTGTPLAELQADGGAPMKVVAETLEVTGEMGQGGLRYCHPQTGVAYFPRGTLTIAGKWSGFSLTAKCRDDDLR